jgi:hypothetical protein
MMIKSWKPDISNNCVDCTEEPITHSLLSCNSIAMAMLTLMKPKYRKRRKPLKYFREENAKSKEGKCTHVC